MQDDTFGNKVVLQMYHNHPPNLHISEAGEQGVVWMRTAWDNNCEEAACLAVGGSIDAYSEKDKAFVEEGVARAYKGMVIKWLEHELPGFNLPFGMEPGAAVFHLLGNDEKMKKLADHWAEMAIGDGGNVGGDDSYFDYYPDYLEGLHQLCQQIDYPDAYNRVHREMTKPGAPYGNGTLGDDEDVLPSQL